MLTHTHQLTIAWGDCDPAGIVFYPRFFDMFDAATAALMRVATGRTRREVMAEEAIISWPMIDTRAVFHAPVRFDDDVRIETRVARLGTASFDIAHQLWRGDTLCATGTETRVWAAPGDGERAVVPRPLPDAVRARMAADQQEDVERGE